DVEHVEIELERGGDGADERRLTGAGDAFVEVAAAVRDAALGVPLALGQKLPDVADDAIAHAGGEHDRLDGAGRERPDLAPAPEVADVEVGLLRSGRLGAAARVLDQLPD